MTGFKQSQCDQSITDLKSVLIIHNTNKAIHSIISTFHEKPSLVPSLPTDQDGSCSNSTGL